MHFSLLILSNGDLPSSPGAHLDNNSAAHLTIHAIIGEASGTLSLIPLSTWCLNALTFSCNLRMAFSALPLQADSPTGLFVGIIWSGHSACKATCSATIDGSWSAFTCHVKLCIPLLCQSCITFLGNHSASPIILLFDNLYAHILPWRCSTTTKCGGLSTVFPLVPDRSCRYI